MSIFSMLTCRRICHAFKNTILCVLTVCLLSGCSPSHAAPPIDSHQIVTAMCAAESALPVGTIRSRGAYPSNATSHLSDALLSALYGVDCLSLFGTVEHADGTLSSPLVDDAAVFLASAQHPCELAVFRCTDGAGALVAAKQCNQRLDAIRQAWRGTDEEVYTGRGCVEIVGNYVLLVVSSDPEAVIEVAKTAIGST